MGVVEIQLFVSLAVMLGAAFVALICDLLKGANEQLRESNSRLRAGRGERESRDVMMERLHLRTLELLAGRMPAPPEEWSLSQGAGEERSTGERHEPAGEDGAAVSRRRRRRMRRHMRPWRRWNAGRNPLCARASGGRPVARPEAAPSEADGSLTTPEAPAEATAGESPGVHQAIAGATNAGVQAGAGPKPSTDGTVPVLASFLPWPSEGWEETAIQAPGERAADAQEEGTASAEPRQTIGDSVREAGSAGTVESGAPADDGVACPQAAPLEEEALFEAVPIRVVPEEEVSPVEQETPPAADMAPADVGQHPPGGQEVNRPAPAHLHEIVIEEPWEEGDLRAGPPSPLPPLPRPKVVQLPVATHAGPEPSLPVQAGFHGDEALAEMLEDRRPFRGLAIVTGLVDYVRLQKEHGHEQMDFMMQKVGGLLLALVREKDFVCRIAEDEFLLLCPGESGQEAKRRVQVTVERLWDFQLRSLGTITMAFSWGAVESGGLPLAEVVDQAREEMLDTRRNRRLLTSGPALDERWAAHQ